MELMGKQQRGIYCLRGKTLHIIKIWFSSKRFNKPARVMLLSRNLSKLNIKLLTK